MRSFLLILFFTMNRMKVLNKFRKAKGQMRKKSKDEKDEKDDKEPKIIAGFDSKAITPPIS